MTFVFSIIYHKYKNGGRLQMTKVIELSFLEFNLTNIFKEKSNKTLQETILTEKYKHLKQ